MTFRFSRLSAVICLLTTLALIDLFSSAGKPPLRLPPGAPRLAVVVVFDQMRGDYLERWQELFAEGGFRRLQEEGAWFRNCHYPYVNTVTGVGHASLLTGCSPDLHGIVGNDWFDRRAGGNVYCVAADRHELVGLPPQAQLDKNRKRKKGASPERLLAPTLGDALKEATAGHSRVVSLSLKDRAAVLMGGHHPDACYWLDDDTGLFVTSTFYRTSLHHWVAEINGSRWADRWFDVSWQHFRPDFDYQAWSGPAGSEGVPLKMALAQGLNFPHSMSAGLKSPGPGYYRSLYNSPFGNDLLLELVRRAIDAEKLGQGDHPDLLCVSFSSNDPIGHCWGPDSEEVLDVTLRSDAIVRQLLAVLDERVGKDRYILALSADHGVCPMPEASHARGRDGSRVDFELLRKNAAAYLNGNYGRGQDNLRWLEDVPFAPWFYLNERLLRERSLQPAEIESQLVARLLDQPGILRACTRNQLEHGLSAEDALGDQIRLSYHPERCGDVMVLLKPYHIFALPLALGTNHGTHHAYDTHVPLLVRGPGVTHGPRMESVTPQSLVEIMARSLGIPPAARAEPPLPANLSIQ